MNPELTIRIDGLGGGRSAFQTVNTRWSTYLRSCGHTVYATVDAPDVVDLTIVHDWTRPFGPPDPAPGGPAVAVRTWDFGPYPKRWVQVIEDHYRELWVGTEWTRSKAIEGGLDPGRVRVVPLGVDLEAFCPDPTDRRHADEPLTFLFVGAAVLRKGVDVLLKAWEQAFGAGNRSVKLVVKDHVDDVFYENQSLQGKVRKLAAARPGQVELLDHHLTIADLVALYRGAHALVLPYRAEGFALPALEAMACGTPPLLPRFGACLDYADDACAELFEVRRIALPVRQEMAYTTLGFTEHVEAIDFAEPDVDTLADALLRVSRWSETERSQRSAAAAKAATGWGWSRSAAVIDQAVRELSLAP